MVLEDTAGQLLDAAQKLVQERGFNAFSYRDLADSVGIRTASIHYHFKTKADLGQGLMERYQARIDKKNASSKSKLKAFIALYKQTESIGAICLCGSMASDWATLEPGIQKSVAAYLNLSEDWVTRQIKLGVKSGEYSIRGKAADSAAGLMASLQGALILSRTRPESSVISKVQSSFLGTLEAA
ncbi:MAG: TetR/AcrR family transcriptional regulator [Planctomycetota bacterium]|nr:TetR/AcrR family transcriptional regulator [Planctomycetota bacterium]